MSAKIPLYSLPDLKNTTDDALPAYLLSLPSSSSSSPSKSKAFIQNHHTTDIRLLLSLTAVALAATTFYLDYAHGFAATRTFTLYAVIAYFSLNAALTYWIWGVEAGAVFAGRHVESGATVRFASRTPAGRYEPVYCLSVTTETGGKRVVEEVRGEYARWFDGEGRFVAGGFQRWLAGGVGVVGRADPGRAEKEAKRGR